MPGAVVAMGDWEKPWPTAAGRGDCHAHGTATDSRGRSIGLLGTAVLTPQPERLRYNDSELLHGASGTHGKYDETLLCCIYAQRHHSTRATFTVKQR